MAYLNDEYRSQSIYRSGDEARQRSLRLNGTTHGFNKRSERHGLGSRHCSRKTWLRAVAHIFGHFIKLSPQVPGIGCRLYECRRSNTFADRVHDPFPTRPAFFIVRRTTLHYQAICRRRCIHSSGLRSPGKTAFRPLTNGSSCFILV